MNVTDIQRMLAATGYYKGGIDGDAGPLTQKAIAVIERTQKRQYTEDPTTWPWTRRGVASAQAILNAWKYDAGAVDGWAGVNTTEAYLAWTYKSIHKKAEVVERTAKTYNPTTDGKIPRQSQVRKFYGTPGKTSGTIRTRLTTIELPFKLRIDYALHQQTNKIRVHEKCAPSLLAALIAVEEHYGLDQMRRLGIDRYAGAYNPRKMRGGSSWSMHAYGCAIDFYAQPNGLRMRCPQALFCGEDYKPFLDIMERHGWLPALRLWGADAMHFQRAKL
jgi:hypothetical protein